MNPWLILIDLLGWFTLGIFGMLAVLIVVALVMAPFKRTKRLSKATPIFKGKRDY